MLFSLTLSLFETAVNKILQTDEVALVLIKKKLNQKRLMVDLVSPAIKVDVFFDETKIRLSQSVANPHSSADCSVHCETVVELIGLLLSTQKNGNLPVKGDVGVLFAITDVMKNAQFNPSLLIQPFVGSAVSGYLKDALASLRKEQQKKAQQASFYAKEWLKEDNDVLAKRWQMNNHTQSVRALRTNVDRLEAKLKRLNQKLTS